MNKTAKTHFDVIVIGGGPAGMMAAGRAGERGKSVLLLEKNTELGKKLNITGGGRCNITNAEYDTRTLLNHYGEAEQFLYSPFSKWGVKHIFEFFEQRGLPLVIEARKRAFPQTQKAPDVTRVLKHYLTKNNVTVKTNSGVSSVDVDRRNTGRIVSVTVDTTRYTADHFIIATGGFSHPETGSTGEGFSWITRLGHTIARPSPTIVPLAVKDSWAKNLSGTSLSFMKITFLQSGEKAFSKTGKLLFTHFGISGPLILNSAKAVGELMKGGEVTATIDMYPDTDFVDVERKVLKILDTNKNKKFKNLLDELVPHGMDSAIVTLLTLPDLEIKAHSITKEDRKRLVHILKGAPLTIKGLMGYDRAVVSDGGVPLGEVDTKTMRSRIVKNLSFAGDVLHVNRPSGGYSLQLCWTTGFVAGDGV
ncbi:MAG: BaiN/RdsA family NAD(P)/FAD-dependent oxidoreductase [Minisyncoccota bacterium]